MSPRFIRDAAQLDQTQASVLRSILQGAHGSSFAKSHGLDRIDDVETFRSALPIVEYDQLAKDIERMVKGEPRVLFEDPPAAFLRTSGSTARARLIPVRRLRFAEALFTSVDDQYDQRLFAEQHPELTLPPRSCIEIAGAPPAIGREGVPTSYLTGYLYALGYPARPELFADPAWFAAIDTSTKLYVLARLSIGMPIRMISGLTNAIIVLSTVLADETQKLIRDVRDGTISVPLSDAARGILPQTAPDPELARRLESAANDHDALRPKDAWPELALVRTMSNGPFAPLRSWISSTFGVPTRELGMHSTEGHCMAIAGGDGDAPMILSIHRNFYEFEDESGVVFLAHEVEVGRRYELIITTYHGLYRYRTKDVAEIVARDEHGVQLRFCGRANTSDLIGEKLTELHVLAALHTTSVSLGRNLGACTLIPVDGTRPFYELLIERSSEPIEDRALRDTFQAGLRQANELYRLYEQELGAIMPLSIKWVERSQFVRLRRRLLHERGEQAKVPALWLGPVPPELD